MRKLFSLFLILLVSLKFNLYGQLFVQDFSSSVVVSDYVNANPNNTQFTYVASSGAGVVISIANGTLQLVRSGANGGYVTRNADFNPVPSLLKVVFDLEVPTATTTTSSAAIFRFGQSYGNDNNTPPNTSTHSRISINLVGAEGFQLRDITTGTNSSTFNGRHTVTWWINNSGASTSYTDPNGNTQILANDKNDVWVSNELVFNELDVVTPTVSLTDFKIVYDSGNGTIQFDNFLMTIETPLPVELSRFDARRVDSQALLSWSTASETNNSHFNIERSPDGREFAEIGRVVGAGTVREKQEYTFIDENPLPGANYYRLRQIDYDGRYSFSPVRRVMLGSLETAFLLFPSPADDYLQVQRAEAGDADSAWEIFDMGGRRLATGIFPAESTETPVFVGDFQAGTYCMRLVSGQHTWTQTFVRR